MTRGRTPAEWVTFGISAAILLVVVAAVALQLRGDEDPPAPVAQVVEVRPVGKQFQVVVAVTNNGDQTAANVQMTGELDIDGEVTTGDQTIDFLAGGEQRRVVFVFPDDPDNGDLTVIVSGFTIP